VDIHEGAKGNAIVGNTIGIDAAGALMSNGESGIYLRNAPDTIIGGFSPEEGNVIGGNGWLGVLLVADISFDAVIAGNRIGVTGDGSPAPNDSGGIQMQGDVDVQVSTNWIANHETYGIVVFTANGAVTTYGSQRNCFTNNKVAVWAPGPYTNLERNYWGAADGPAPTGSGDAIQGNVIFNPYFSSVPNFLGYATLVCPASR
jgi:hypothetical protein